MARERTALQKKIDGFCRAIFLTEDGRPKSSFLLYSFCLSLVFFVLYLACYMVLIDFIGDRMEGSGYLRLEQILEYLVPAIVGTVPCLLLMAVTKKQRNMVPAAFGWMFFITIATLIAMIFMCDKTDFRTEYGIFISVIGIPMSLSSVLGFCGSKIVYNRFFGIHNN